MKKPQQLHALGQRIWLDNITRDMLDDGTLQRYINDLAVTGLTSNPSIFDAAIGGGSAYDKAIHSKAKAGLSGETLFFELAIEDLQRAADLFRPLYDKTQGVDGWVSLEVSPLLADDTAGTIAAAKSLHKQAARPNLFIKIPGTAAGVPAIEESIFAGIPVNVTLLFSAEHYVAAAEAYLRGLERRVAAGLSPVVESVASVFVSRWDGAVADKVPAELKNQLGIAVSAQSYRAYLDLLASPRWQKLAAAGAHPQRLLWASTGVKDPNAGANLYVDSLGVPNTVNTMPEKTLLTVAADDAPLSPAIVTEIAKAEALLAKFAPAGVDINALAKKLQDDGAVAFVKSWTQLLQRIVEKSSALASPRM